MTGADVTDGQGFGVELLPHLDALYRLAWHLARDPTLAEDLVQDTALLALGSWKFQPGTNLRAWLLTILRHRFLNEQQRARRTEQLADGDSLEVPAMEGAADQGADDGLAFFPLGDTPVAEATDELPAAYRAPLLLSSVEGMTYQEIATVLGVPIGTVRSRIFRARQTVRTKLREHAVAAGYIPAVSAPPADGTVCRVAKDLLYEYLKHELTPQVAVQIHDHLTVCCPCQACERFEHHYLALLRTALERQRCPETTRDFILGVVAGHETRISEPSENPAGAPRAV